jgi:hypothetical protein
MRAFKVKSPKNTPRIIGFSVVLLYIVITFGVLKIDFTQITFDMATTVLAVAEGKFGNIPPSIIGFAIDIFLGSVGFLFWVYFFSQFVLPINSFRERKLVPQRVLGFLGGSGTKGPAIFLQDGVQITSKEESERSGPGVILADSSSGAIIHRMGSFVKSIGPGLTFTKKGEKILSAIDLRIQKRSIGPIPGDELFPKTKTDSATDSENKQKHARKMQTSGLTRDGIEIIPSIEVTFKIDAIEGEGNSYFGYREESVINAIRNESIFAGSENNGNPKTIPWDWLPVHLAADLWKEYLRKVTLNEIFEISASQNNREIDDSQTINSQVEPTKTTYSQILDEITNRLTKEKYRPLSRHGQSKSTVGREFSREYKLLKNQGIKVLSVKISNLQLKEEQKIIDQWKTSWEQRAVDENHKIIEHNQILQQKAEDESLKNLSHHIISFLSQSHVKKGKQILPPNTKDTLTYLLEGTQNYVAGNPRLNNSLANEKESLDNILERIKSQSND